MTSTKKDLYNDRLDEFRTERRELFLDAASEVLAAKGIRQTKMDDIAAKAGVSKVVLYRYFGAKDRLVHAVLERVVDQIINADAEIDGWWTERVRHTLSVVKANRQAIIVLLKHAAHDPEFGIHSERLHKAINELIEARVGEIFEGQALTPLDAHGLGDSVTTFFFYAYLQWLESGNLDNEAEFFEWITKSVRAICYYWYKVDPPADA